MAKHRRSDGEPTEIINMQGQMDLPDEFEEEYKPRRYEQHVGEVTRIKESDQ